MTAADDTGQIPALEDANDGEDLRQVWEERDRRYRARASDRRRGAGPLTILDDPAIVAVRANRLAEIERLGLVGSDWMTAHDRVWAWTAPVTF